MSHSVLVVEDEPNIVLSLKFVMEKAGFSVRIADDGDKALEEIKKDIPDLVLLDIMLPKRDGFSVCEAIRANPDWSSMKIVMLSAKSREADKEKALAIGADDFMSKPFSTRELDERVKTLLGIKNGLG